MTSVIPSAERNVHDLTTGDYATTATVLARYAKESMIPVDERREIEEELERSREKDKERFSETAQPLSRIVDGILVLLNREGLAEKSEWTELMETTTRTYESHDRALETIASLPETYEYIQGRYDEATTKIRELEKRVIYTESTLEELPETKRHLSELEQRLIGYETLNNEEKEKLRKGLVEATGESLDLEELDSEKIRDLYLERVRNTNETLSETALGFQLTILKKRLKTEKRIAEMLEEQGSQLIEATYPLLIKTLDLEEAYKILSAGYPGAKALHHATELIEETDTLIEKAKERRERVQETIGMRIDRIRAKQEVKAYLEGEAA